MNTGTQTTGKTPKDYLSPESQQELDASKAKVQEELKNFKNPGGAALTALQISSIISDALHMGFIDKTEAEKFMQVVVEVNRISTKMADEAFSNFEAEQAVTSGLAKEA